jgi:hypothetical protein
MPLDLFYSLKKHHLTLEIDPLGCALTKGQCIYELELHGDAEANLQTMTEPQQPIEVAFSSKQVTINEVWLLDQRNEADLDVQVP